jgi:hypothetical protein
VLSGGVRLTRGPRQAPEAGAQGRSPHSSLGGLPTRDLVGVGDARTSSAQALSAWGGQRNRSKGLAHAARWPWYLPLLFHTGLG